MISALGLDCYEAIAGSTVLYFTSVVRWYVPRARRRPAALDAEGCPISHVAHLLLPRRPLKRPKDHGSFIMYAQQFYPIVQ